ncbi:hypothetical protein PBS_03130 [Paraburkholderia sp. 2C]
MLVFGQLWVSAYACAAPAATMSSDAGAMMTVAAGSHSDLRDAPAAAACHLHCNDFAQPDHADLPTLSPTVWLPVIWGSSSILALAGEPQRCPHPAPILVSAPPPHRILFQVFRT